MAEQLRVTPGLDSAYVAGSLTAGLGNATSDVDLFLLSESDSVADEPVQFEQNGERVDVEWMTLADVHRNLDRLDSFTLTPQSLGELWPFFPTLDWYARVLSSQEVIGSRSLLGIRERARAMEPAVTDLIMARWALGYSSSIEDFAGAEQERDYDTASYSGSALCVAAGKAYAASVGDLYLGHKWIYKQLRRSAPALDFDMFAHYARGWWVPEGSHGARRLLWYGQTLLGAAALNRQLAEPLTDLPTDFRDSGPRRVDDRVPVNLDSKILLHHETRGQVRISPKVALVWLWCTGRAEAELVDEVRAAAGKSGIDIAPAEVARVVERLIERGLVVAE